MKYVQNFALILCSLLVTVGLVETSFYLLNKFQPPKPAIETFESTFNNERLEFFQYHSVYGYAGLPKVNKEFYGKRVTHNSTGLRGPDLSLEPGKNNRRIAFIGDSQTWGWGVADDETIAEYTKSILNARQKDIVYESVNLGGSGYGIDQSYLRLIGEGFFYKPSLVVFTYFAENDIFETNSTAAWGVEKPYIYQKSASELCVSNVPPRRASGWPADNLSFIAEKVFGRSSFQFTLFGSKFDLATTQTAKFFKNRSLASPMFSTWKGKEEEQLKIVSDFFGCVEQAPGPQLPSWEEKRNWAVKLIQHIRDASEKHGAEFVVIAKPPVDDYMQKKPSRDYRYVLRHLRHNGITVVDMYDEAMNLNMTNWDLYTEAAHLSAQGNKLAAEKIADFVTAKHLSNAD